MKEYMPDYYRDFRCIAGKCKDNCCIGWDIMIDDESYERYQNVETPLKHRLEDGIKKEEQQFCLDEQGRCVFLNKENLCDIYIELGEGALCEICTQHPRFHNEYGHIRQSGIGLACEEAARMILRKQDIHMEVIQESCGEVDEWAEELMKIELRLLNELNKQDVLIKDKINRIYNWAAAYQEQLNLTGDLFYDLEEKEIKSYDVVKKMREKDDIKNWLEFYENLDYMDEKFRDLLTQTKESLTTDHEMKEENEIYIKQLLGYFIYRHFIKSYEDDNLLDKVKFAILSTKIICCIDQYCKKQKLSFTSLEIARLYSKEIEYSEDNIEAIFEEFLFN